MEVSHINNFSVNFQNHHKIHDDKNVYSTKSKVIAALGAKVGTSASLLLLAKCAKNGNSAKYTSIFRDYKNSYFANVKYGPKEIISLGAGSCLGGLASGYCIDKNSDNRKAKLREAVLAMGNISLPILTVDLMVDKLFANAKKWQKATAGIAGLFIGVGLANIVMNKLNNLIFNNKDERGVRLADFSAHVDDMVVAGQYISDAKIIKLIGRIIPFALMIPGYKVSVATKENK